MSITIFNFPTENEYLALTPFICRNAEQMFFSDFYSAHLIMFLSDIFINFVFNDATDLAEWVEYF